eukprot:355668-Chlamydomonas_euryale.AAC.2
MGWLAGEATPKPLTLSAVNEVVDQGRLMEQAVLCWVQAAGVSNEIGGGGHAGRPKNVRSLGVNGTTGLRKSFQKTQTDLHIGIKHVYVRICGDGACFGSMAETARSLCQLM